MTADTQGTTVHIAPGGVVYPPVKIKSSGKDVIASGTVHTFANDNLEVSIAQFKFVFNFLSDSGEQRVSFRNDSQTTLILDIYNFTNSLGSGTVTPYRLGSLMGRELWLGFMVYALSESSSKTVHYTFMLGSSANE
ncbi:MAG: hypothetical protein EOO15_18550 [Chitinophagaceae bacterium]|nr:MAG: hypothetical protein EOO15_18550 [Chitinophagaceae bacterium]